MLSGCRHPVEMSRNPRTGESITGVCCLCTKRERLAQSLIHPVGSIAAHGGHPVGVSVEGQLYRGVTGEVLDVLRVHAVGEQDREAGVPEIVPADGGELRTLEQGFEVPVDYVLGVEGCALARREHEARILVVARPKLLLKLALAVAPEGFYGPLRQIYGASAGVLRLHKDQPATLAYPMQLPDHPKRADVEVYIRPLEPQRLSAPKPYREGQDIERLELLAARRLEEPS